MNKINWDKVKVGSKFTCKILGKKIEGRIQIDEYGFHLCQNVVDGSDCINKLGYLYSWVIGNNSTSNELKDIYYVINLKITPDPKFVIPYTVIILNKVVEFRKGYIKIGCNEINNNLVTEIFCNLID